MRSHTFCGQWLLEMAWGKKSVAGTQK